MKAACIVALELRFNTVLGAAKKYKCGRSSLPVYRPVDGASTSEADRSLVSHWQESSELMDTEEPDEPIAHARVYAELC